MGFGTPVEVAVTLGTLKSLEVLLRQLLSLLGWTVTAPEYASAPVLSLRAMVLSKDGINLVPRTARETYKHLQAGVGREVNSPGQFGTRLGRKVSDLRGQGYQRYSPPWSQGTTYRRNVDVIGWQFESVETTRPTGFERRHLPG